MMTLNEKHEITIPNYDWTIEIDENKVIYCLANGNYTKVMLEDEKTLLVTKPLTKVLNSFPQELFARIHKSHIVNIQHIKSLNNSNGQKLAILSDGTELPISKNRIKDFLKRFRKI